jgi:hypothetical protein
MPGLVIARRDDEGIAAIHETPFPVHQGPRAAFGEEQMIAVARMDEHSARGIDVAPIAAQEFHARHALLEILGLVPAGRDHEGAALIDEAVLPVGIDPHQDPGPAFLEGIGLGEGGGDDRPAFGVHIAPGAFGRELDGRQAFGIGLRGGTAGMARSPVPIDMRPGSVGLAHARQAFAEGIGLDVTGFDGGAAFVIEVTGLAVLPDHREAFGEFPDLVE